MLNESLLLVKRLRTKDERAFQELSNKFGPRLIRAAKFLIASEPAATELVSDTLVDAFFNIDKFKQKSSLFSWLYRILLNNFYDQLRRQKKEVVFEVTFRPIAKPLDTSDQERLSLFQRYLPSLLNKLSHEHREVVLLKFLEGMRAKEIAKALKIPEGTVRTRLHHAIINSRKILKELNVLEDDTSY